MNKVQANSKELVIITQKYYLEEIENFLHGLFKENRINISKFSQLLLCVSEGVSNAIIHGNRNIEGKLVHLKIEINENITWVTIKDEGHGFNYNDLPDPTNNKNLKKEKGRGLFIIKTYAEEVCFKNNGSTLVIKFKLSDNKIL